MARRHRGRDQGRRRRGRRRAEEGVGARGEELNQLAELRAKLAAAAAADTGHPVTRRARIDAAIALIVALVDELEDEAADDLIARTLPLVSDEEAFRRRLAGALVAIRAHDRAAAKPAPRADDPEVAARTLAAAGDEQALRKALEHATASGDRALIEEMTLALCELLVARDAIADARTLLDVLALASPRADALRDELRRRQGEYVADPPDEPDEPAHLDPRVRVYVHRPHNIAQSIVDGGLLDVRAFTTATITRAAELESQPIFGPVRAFWCACGRYRGRRYANLACARCGVEVIHSSVRRTRCARILLDAPVVHPWYAHVAAQLLDFTDRTIASATELRDALRAVELDALVAKLKHEIVTAPKAKLADAAGRRLGIVEAFRAARVRPDAIVFDAVLVVPPQADLGIDRTAVRDAYAALLEEPGQRTVDALFAAFARG